MSSPLITIGIATFNASSTIRNAIISALRQTWTNKEIIIIDDCSEDDTFKIINSFKKKYKEIKVFRNIKNQGIGAVRNLIIEKSRGEFLAFFDDDDESVIDRLKIQYERIIKYKKTFNPSSPIICHSNREIKYSNGEKRLYKTMGLNTNRKCPNGENVAKRILLGKPLKDGYGSCPTCCQMAKLSTFKKVQGFDKSFRRAEDTDLCIRLALIGTHFVGVDKALVKQNMTLTTDKSLDIDFKYSKLLIKKYKKFINANGSYLFCMEWLKIKHNFYKRSYFQMLTRLIRLFFLNPFDSIERFAQSLSNLKLNTDYLLFHEKRFNEK
tara:strand:+ start:7758 stop:8729 length:972 start_codon:yes stop_codon:yes gene_type:complete